MGVLFVVSAFFDAEKIECDVFTIPPEISPFYSFGAIVFSVGLVSLVSGADDFYEKALVMDG